MGSNAYHDNQTIQIGYLDDEPEDYGNPRILMRAVMRAMKHYHVVPEHDKRRYYQEWNRQLMTYPNHFEDL
jgi:hypothetical protein